MTQVLPPMGKDKWFYIIHERLEPKPQDDLQDPMYSGEAILVLSWVPLQCEAVDLRAWLLFGVAQDFPPLLDVMGAVSIAEKKKVLIKQKINALPSIEVQGTPEQQTEMRKKLAEALTTHMTRYDQELAQLSKKRKRMLKFLKTEPMELSVLPKELSISSAKNQETRVETRTWIVQLTSTRGTQLASIAMEKSDWNYVCLVQTRPEPRAYLEDDQIANEIISSKDLAKEINMRSVRLRRMRHGAGDYLQPQQTSILGSDVDKPKLSPLDEGFHISSIGALYTGQWRLGEKHGRGKEFSNTGVYDGEFESNTRQGSGKMTYGKGDSVMGSFERPLARRVMASGSKFQGRPYPCSLLNGSAFREGVEHGDHTRIVFADGATYEGEMRDGRITGHGRYTSSTGVVEEGMFVDGLLQGDGGTKTLPNGLVQQGSFRDGLIHGRGQQQDRHGNSYDGFFYYGTKEGRGVSRFANGRAKHVGFWHENAMNGRGDFYYKREHSGDATEPSAEQPNDNENDSKAADGFDQWDLWYEGSFLHGETQARHRNVDVHKCTVHHSPFTTNGKSDVKAPYLTNVLPQQLKKQEARTRTNNQRRTAREKAYLQKREFANLSLYFGLLDSFYEQWAAQKQQDANDQELDSDELRQAQQQRADQAEFEANRIKFRKEKYNLSPRKRDLASFETYLERIALTEHTRLERAMANEAVDLLKPPSAAAKAKQRD